MKMLAAYITGSAAIFGDALESIVNVVAAAMVVVSIRIANVPADENHPYGHGRIEALSAGLEGAMLLAAAAGIVFNAWPALFDPRPLTALGSGLLLIVFTTAVNFGIGALLVRNGHELHSMALVADGKHLIADAVTSVAMLAGLGLVALTDLVWLDPVVALLLGAWVAWSGFGVLREAVGSLMNEQRDSDVETVAKLLEERAPASMMVPHGLRILDAGTLRFIHLEVFAPGDWTLERTHELSQKIGQILEEGFAGRVRVDVVVRPCPPHLVDRLTRHEEPIRPETLTSREPVWPENVETATSVSAR